MCSSGCALASALSFARPYDGMLRSNAAWPAGVNTGNSKLNPRSPQSRHRPPPPKPAPLGVQIPARSRASNGMFESKNLGYPGPAARPRPWAGAPAPGAGPAPRACDSASAAETRANTEASAIRRRMPTPTLVDDLARTTAPPVVVSGAKQRQQTDAFVRQIAAGISGNDDVVADLQRVFADALSAKLPGAAPFDGVARDRTVLLLHGEMHEGMRVSVQELNDVPLDRHHLILQVGRGERVVGGR